MRYVTVLSICFLLSACGGNDLAFRGAPPAGMTAAEYECKLTGNCYKPDKPAAGVTGPMGF